MQMEARQTIPTRTELEEYERRRDAEADGVAQAVELAAELARRLGQPGDVAVEHIEDHGSNDQPAGDREEEIIVRFCLGGNDLACKGDGDETADAIAERQQGRDDCNLAHGVRLNRRKTSL